MIRKIRFNGCGFAYGYYFGVAQWLKTMKLVTDETKIGACSGGCFAALALRSKNNILEIGKKHAMNYGHLHFVTKMTSVYTKQRIIMEAFDDLTEGGIDMSGLSIYTSNISTGKSVLHENFRDLDHLKTVVVASCAIPLFTSMGVALDGHYHVDGGLYAPGYNGGLSVSVLENDDVSPSKDIGISRKFVLGYRSGREFNMDAFLGSVDIMRRFS